MLQLTTLKEITLTGELCFRLGRNFSRLEDPMYRAGEIFSADQQGWPGDWEGRTILALCLLEDITHRRAAFLEDILSELSRQWNSQGYLKEIYLPETVDEQQLSGHNWLLRGLLELHLRQRDQRCRYWAERIVQNLYLPLLGRFSSYPSRPELRAGDGGAAGHIGSAVSGWRLSTDIGCAFISFDALGQYYSLFGGQELRSLLWEMFEAFRAIDLEACHVQTHATLSALRGILRFYEAERDPALLRFAVSCFELYQSQAMTANYANYNWFGRPQWTEPCAIVDSFLVAVHLFRFTGDSRYLPLSNRIYYNGLLASQRYNGGFGCDSCVGSSLSPDILQPTSGAFEAYWCCSMRGAEGLSFAAASAVLWEKSDIYLTNPLPGTYRSGERVLKLECETPWENAFTIRLRGLSFPQRLHIYLPDQACNVTVFRNGEPVSVHSEGFLIGLEVCEGSVVTVSYCLSPTVETAPNGRKIRLLGDRILARSPSGERPLSDRLYGPPEEIYDLNPDNS